MDWQHNNIADGEFTVEDDRAVVVKLGEMAAAGKIQHLWRSGGEFFALSKCYPTYQLPVINGIIYNPYKWPKLNEELELFHPYQWRYIYIPKKEFGGK